MTLDYNPCQSLSRLCPPTARVLHHGPSAWEDVQEGRQQQLGSTDHCGKEMGCGPGLAVLVPTGFGDRLLSEVKKLAPKDVKIKVRLKPSGAVDAGWGGGTPAEPVPSCTVSDHSWLHLLGFERGSCVFIQSFVPSRSLLLRNGCTPHGSGEIGLKQKGLGRDWPGKADGLLSQVKECEI